MAFFERGKFLAEKSSYSVVHVGYPICTVEIQNYSGLLPGPVSEQHGWTKISDVSQVLGKYPGLDTDVAYQWGSGTRSLGHTRTLTVTFTC